MDNKNIFKNLNFNEAKQTLKQTVDKANNSNDVLWVLLFLIFVILQIYLPFCFYDHIHIQYMCQNQ